MERAVLTGGSDVVDRAAAEARSAAEAARVVVRPAQSDGELSALITISDALWGPGATFTAHAVRAFVHAGSVVLIAWDAEGRAVGFSLGFLGWSGGLHLHSHQTGVLQPRRGSGVGYALKLAQREACLRGGVREVRWTFDPLVRRNGAFNLGRLGAEAVAFAPDFYGRMHDAVNSDDLSDRLEARWWLERPLPTAPSHRTALHAVLADAGGWPQVVGDAGTPGGHVAVPADHAAMRRSEPGRARAWRLAVREVLVAAYAAGLRVVAVDATGYVLEEGARG